ncbi:MAG: hypothetical protein WC862_03535 [Patescibacteria group bacterium]
MFKTKTAFIISAIIFSFVFFVPLTATFAGDYGLSETATAAGLIPKYQGSMMVLAGNVIGAGLSMIGVLFFVLMVYAGILWMTARGNEEHTKKALNTIIAASIGMVIVLASYAITSFVLKSVEGGAIGSEAVESGGDSMGNTGTGADTCPSGTHLMDDGECMANSVEGGAIGSEVEQDVPPVPPVEGGGM